MYKLTSRISILFIISITVLHVTSCTKQKESRIKDTWRYIEVENVASQTEFEVWDLSDEESLTISKYPIFQATNPKLIGNGRFEIQKSLTSPFYIAITGIGPYYDGKWEVLEIKRNKLIILLDQYPYWIYREFEKY